MKTHFVSEKLVVDGQSAGHRLVVLPSSVAEGGVEGGDGQPLLQFTLQGFKLVLGQFAATALLQGIFYLGTGSCYGWSIECLTEEVGSTLPNLLVFCKNCKACAMNTAPRLLSKKALAKLSCNLSAPK